MTRQLGTIEQIVRFLIAIQVAALAYYLRHYSDAASAGVSAAALALLASALWPRRRRAYQGPERRRPSAPSWSSWVMQ